MSNDIPRYFDPARNALRTERERSRAECDAFEAFRDRILELDAAPASGTSAAPAAGPGGIRVGGGPGGASIDAVREAYEETVVAVPHYDEEYTENPDEHLSAELGSEVVAALAGNEQLTPSIQQGLVAAAREAHASRQEVIAIVEEEFAALDEAEPLLNDVLDELDGRFEDPLDDWPTGRLFDVHDRLDDLEDRLNEYAKERQRMLDERPQSKNHPAGRGATVGFLYRSLDVPYPILSDLTAVIERIETHREDVEHEIASR